MKSILKTNIPDDSKLVWDIFELDSLNRQLGLSAESIISMLDKFSGVMNVPKVEIQAELVTALFKHMGGNINTPTNETMAFMYILLNSPNFRFPEFHSMMVNAIYVDNTLRYLSELELNAPPQFIQAMYDTIGNAAVINILNFRYTILLKEMDDEAADLFAKGIQQHLESYYSGGSALDAFPDVFSN